MVVRHLTLLHYGCEKEMKIFLDDIRFPPDNSWQIVRKASDCIRLLGIYGHCVKAISFDHDLGNDKDGTGYDVASWIEEQCYYKAMTCPNWRIHSANPVGRKNIANAMKNAEKYSKGY